MGTKIGKDCKVAIGAASVVGMGTWSLSGITSDSLEDTEFGDNWKTFKFGIKDGGQVTFNGLFDPADTTGQGVLKAANLDNTNLTTLRLYIDNTSYYEPCQTTSWWTASDSTNNETFPSHVNVTSYDISSDKSGLMQTSFTCKVSGCMVLV
jgi:hypothetical protein